MHQAAKPHPFQNEQCTSKLLTETAAPSPPQFASGGAELHPRTPTDRGALSWERQRVNGDSLEAEAASLPQPGAPCRLSVPSPAHSAGSPHPYNHPEQ